MLRFLIVFIFSIAITNWAYEEVTMFYPGFEDLVSEVSQAISIPTHDAWDKYLDVPKFAHLEKDLTSFFDSRKINFKTDTLLKKKIKVSKLDSSGSPIYEMLAGEDAFLENHI